MPRPAHTTTRSYRSVRPPLRTSTPSPTGRTASTSSATTASPERAGQSAAIAAVVRIEPPRSSSIAGPSYPASSGTRCASSSASSRRTGRPLPAAAAGGLDRRTDGDRAVLGHHLHAQSGAPLLVGRTALLGVPDEPRIVVGVAEDPGHARRTDRCRERPARRPGRRSRARPARTPCTGRRCRRPLLPPRDSSPDPRTRSPRSQSGSLGLRAIRHPRLPRRCSECWRVRRSPRLVTTCAWRGGVRGCSTRLETTGRHVREAPETFMSTIPTTSLRTTDCSGTVDR